MLISDVQKYNSLNHNRAIFDFFSKWCTWINSIIFVLLWDKSVIDKMAKKLSDFYTQTNSQKNFTSWFSGRQRSISKRKWPATYIFASKRFLPNNFKDPLLSTFQPATFTIKIYQFAHRVQASWLWNYGSIKLWSIGLRWQHHSH